MKTKHVPLNLLLASTLLFTGCPGGPEQSKSNEDTLKSASKETLIQAMSLSNSESQDSAERAAQDTMGFNEYCDTCDACDNTARWLKGTTSGGGTEITSDKARGDVQRFYLDHGMISGGFISKLALDSIFCHHKNYNGIFAYVAKDDAGRYYMVIEGWEDNIGTDKARVNILPNPSISGPDKFRFFSSDLLCPTICGYAGM